MQKITYTHAATGQSWDYRLPRILRLADRDVMGITEATMAQFGITKTTVDIPDAPHTPIIISDALAAKERVFAAMLLHYATAFSVDLTTLPDINISAMLQAAQAAGATAAEIADATAMLLAAKADIEAEAGGSWAECWQGLKERLPGYLNEMTQ
jgi:hypothetical protein